MNREKIDYKPLKMIDKVTITLSEFLGTAVLLFVACMGCVPNSQNELLPESAAIVSGLAVMITIFLFGHISGAHVNPLTSINAVIVGQISFKLLPFYLLAQLTGALSGYGMLKYVTPAYRLEYTEGNHGVCATVPHTDLTAAQALVAEIIFSLILSFANCSSWDPRNVDKADSMPLKFGFLVGTLIMAGGTYTGASMNPFKSFAPAAWNNDWERHWVYWVGPLTSAVAVPICYRMLVLKGKNCQIAIEDPLQ
ncbi:hypothetical protein PPYR_08143 [Photinus pyralis]|uniref:Aquaporin n=1 Tax=Photinus pyralis TaxID=7054 RepID=A0A5N4AIM8_PHOPY|nr:aquaporin-8-like [Photinus pyralis]KAB0797149.1 hypothetical protein PPYR_08143 [Photinus pyralis]